MRTSNIALFATTLALLVGAVAGPAAATEPEAFVGTFMPHGLPDGSYVDANLGVMRDAMELCYAAALDDDDTARGLVLLRVFVQPDGTIPRVDVLDDGTGNPALVGCVETALENTQLEPLEYEHVSVTLPVTFRPSTTTLAQR